MSIQTERLVLKAISDNDQATLIEIFCNDIVKQTYMLPDFTSEEQAIRLFNRFKELSLKDDRYVYGIYKDEKLIGFLNDVEIKDNTIEMGYVVHPNYHNQGYATEAFKGVITKLLDDGFEEVIAGAFENNLASMRVMEKCGMSKKDYQDEIEYRGKTHKCIYYSIKRNI